MAFPDDYRRCALTIQSSQVPGNLSNFPVLLTEACLPSEMFDADGSYPCQSDGGDIRFSSDNEGKTRLPCEIVEITTDNNPANGTAQIWVKVPSVSGSSDTTIYIWYGTTGKSQPDADDAYGSEAVWDSNYKGVYHLEESVSAANNNFRDSTNNDNHLTLNSTSGITSEAGPVGQSLRFDGSGNYLYDNGLGNDVETSSVTIELWIKSDSASTDAGFFHGDTPNEEDAGCMARYDAAGAEGGQSGVIKAGFGDVDNEPNNSKLESSAGQQTTDDQHLAFAWTQNSAPDLFVNGSEDTPSWDRSSNTAIDINNNPLRFGIGSKDTLGSSGWDGQIGEIRVSTTKRSADWIGATYNNQNAPGSFVSEGTPESVTGTYTEKVSDDFNRSDEFLQSSSNWTKGTGYLDVTSNRVDTGSTFSTARYYWSGASPGYTDHQYVQAKIYLYGGSTTKGGLFVRFQDVANYYYANIDEGGNWEIGKRVATTVTVIASGSTTFSDGAVMRLAVWGGTLMLTYNGTEIAEVEDGSLSTGDAGIYYSSSGNKGGVWDDWSAGEVEIVTTQTGNAGVASLTLNATGTTASFGTATGSVSAVVLTLNAINPTGAGSSAVTGSPGIGIVTLNAIQPTGSGSSAVTGSVSATQVTLNAIQPTGAGSNAATSTSGIGVITLNAIDTSGSLGGAPQTGFPGVGGITLNAIPPSGAGSSAVSSTPGIGVITLNVINPSGDASATGLAGIGLITLNAIPPTGAGSSAATGSPGIGIITVNGIGVTGSGGLSVGDRYLVGASATGSWSGHDDEIAEWNGTGWDFYTPKDGYILYVVSENTYYIYDQTAWVDLREELKTLRMSTEDLEFVNAGSAGATEQDWLEVTVGGNTGYIRIHATK